MAMQMSDFSEKSDICRCLGVCFGMISTALQLYAHTIRVNLDRYPSTQSARINSK